MAGQAGPESDPVARVLGSSYLLHELLGQGATGEVWRGTYRPTGEPVAVKLLHPALAADNDLIARFLRERAILTQLRDPHLVGVRDLVAEGGTLAIVMDLVQGSDLRRFLTERGTLAPSLAATLMMHVLSALQAGHDAGVVHRDIKPENILLDLSDPGSPQALLSDFGIARLTQGPSLTQIKGTIGTPEYMAPEIAEDGDATAASDIYAVGIVLYELVAGRSPFSGGSPLQVLRRQVDALPARPPGMPDALWGVIESCLAKRPEDRPSSARQLARQLRGVADELAPLGPLPRAPAGSTYLKTPRPGATDTPVPTPTPPTPSTTPLGRSSLGRWGRGAPERAEPVRADPTRPAPARPVEADVPPSAPLPTYIPGGRQPERPKGLAARWAGLGPWRWAVPGALALVLILGVLFALNPFEKRPPPPNVSAKKTFDPVLVDGMAVVRNWVVNPDGLQVVLGIGNPGAAPVTQTVDEVIPKSLASSVGKIRFAPPVPETVEADPVVRYRLENLGGGQTALFAYVIPLQGVTQQQFDTWAGDQSRAVRDHTTLGKLTVAPSQITMAPGQSLKLDVQGTMKDGTSADPADLAGVAWTSSSPDVAVVVLGNVVAVRPGETTITAKAGDAEGQTKVTVQPGAPPPVAQGPSPRPTRAPAPKPIPTQAAPPPAPPARSPSPTAEPCPIKAEPVTDPKGNKFGVRFYCGTYAGSAVYANPTGSDPLDDSGFMSASNSVWVVCQVKGRANPVVAGNTNTWWLYTQGDRAAANTHGYSGGWGYLPATVVKQGGQNEAIPGVDTCSRVY
jgi:serine/threonine-protein kinase